MHDRTISLGLEWRDTAAEDLKRIALGRHHHLMLLRDAMARDADDLGDATKARWSLATEPPILTT